MMKTYSELIKLPTFKERFEYLNLDGVVADRTFGADRYLNQAFYNSKEWKSFRRSIIIRDNGCDLAMPDREIHSLIIIHHLNPIRLEDLENQNGSAILDPENVVCVSFKTHQALHYSNFDMLPKDPVERKPFDTCPWR